MPIEIMELVVKATIKDEKARAQSQPTQTQNGQALNKKILTQEIIEQVLEILQQQKER